MVKYRLTTPNGFIDFTTEQAAIDFAPQLEISEPEIVPIEFDPTPAPRCIVNAIVLSPEQTAQLATDDASRNFSNRLTAILKVLNKDAGLSLAQSLWAHHRLRAMEISVTQGIADAVPSVQALVGQTILIDTMNLVISGDIETAWFVFANATPDDGSQPFHCLNAEFLGFLRNQIGIYLGWE